MKGTCLVRSFRFLRQLWLQGPLSDGFLWCAMELWVLASRPGLSKRQIYKSYQLRLVKWNLKFFSDLKVLKSVKNQGKGCMLRLGTQQSSGRATGTTTSNVCCGGFWDYALSVNCLGCASFISKFVAILLRQRKFRSQKKVTESSKTTLRQLCLILSAAQPQRRVSVSKQLFGVSERLHSILR